jgi:MurNAc alpha-1-phosphate uridylyltransferase
MILAAGRGERMRPLSDHTPKPLLEVAGQPLIAHHLRRLADCGVCDVVINTAWLAEKLHAVLGDGSAFGLRIHYSDEGTALETAGGIARALPLLGDAPFWVINGDIYCDLDPRQLQLGENDLACLALVDNPLHHPSGDFALHDGRVSNTGESRLTFAGIGCYHPTLFDTLPSGKQALGPLLRSAIGHDRVAGLHHQGQWCDVGTPERLDALRETLRHDHN